MKKVISIVLCIVFIFSFSVVANASESSKLSPDLVEALNNCEPEDTVGIDIGFNGKNYSAEDMPSWPDLTAARKELRDFYDAKNAEYCSILFENIEYKTVIMGTSAFIVEVKAQDVAKISEYDIVRDISLYENIIFGPVDNTVLKSSFMAQYNIEEAKGYKELYFHMDENGELEWALIQGEDSSFVSPKFMEVVVGDVLVSSFISSPFKLTYGIYDAKEDKFYDLYDIKDEYSNYEGLVEALVGNSGVHQIGDVNNDGKISVMDATYIQRYLADIEKNIYKETISDFDRDGDVTIIDATAIQRKLAQLDVPVDTPVEG
ncbi:MAG: hypothetical protein E7513_02605 [Ruminococcaceae bacterium]|nr:hypothetical protein [Oscillospiraceae bacterium]